MNVLMVGVDQSRKGGMWTVVENYLMDKDFCQQTNLMYIPTATFGSIPHRLLFSAKAFIRIYRQLRKQKTDIIHIHMAERGSTFRAGIIEKIAGHFGCKIIIHMHGAEFAAWYNHCGNYIQKIIRKVLDRADTIIILGSYLKDFINPLIVDSNKIQVLYNAVQMPETNPYSADAKQILFFALPIPRKGIFDLLQAYKQIDESIRQKYQLLICGVSSEYQESLSKKIYDLCLQDTVSVTGWINGDQKLNIIEKTAINVLPSYSEGLPMTILETMAYGIPNISTNIAAIPEVIQNGENGILIKPGDIEGLSKSIKTLLLDKKSRMKMSNKAYMTIKENFELQGHKTKLINIYKKVLGYLD